MSNSISIRQQPSTSSSAISKQASMTSTGTQAVYSCEQQEKLLNLQGEVDLLLAQIQAETNLLTAR